MSKEEIPQPIIIIEGRSPDSPDHPWVKFMQKYHLKQWIDHNIYTAVGGSAVIRYVCHNKDSLKYLKGNTDLPVISEKEYNILLKYQKLMELKGKKKMEEKLKS